MGFHPPAIIGRAVNAFRREAPPRPRPTDPPSRPRNFEVFAVGADWCQLTWSGLGPGRIDVDVAWTGGDATCSVSTDGGPGAAGIEHLPTDTDCTVTVSGPGIERPVTRVLHTLPRPAGVLLGRVATVSDSHLGSSSTGYFHTLREKPEPDEVVTARCLTSALDAIDGWGANMVLVKGDLVDDSTPENWELAATLLARLDVPLVAVPGNHEHAERGTIDPFRGAADVGIDLVRGVRVHDLDSADGRVRVIAADVGTPGSDRGRLDHVTADIVAAAETAPGACLVGFHQQPMRFPLPTYIPVGIPGPQGRRLCERLREVDAHAMVTAGHTHRNRRHDMAGVTVTEVGSTRDFPGVWAGYEFYEGGVIQTVRRVTEPSSIRWTDYTRRSALGRWGPWAKGGLDDRCFTLNWR